MPGAGPGGYGGMPPGPGGPGGPGGMGMSMPPPGVMPPGADQKVDLNLLPPGVEVGGQKATDAISKTLAAISPGQMQDVMAGMKVGCGGARCGLQNIILVTPSSFSHFNHSVTLPLLHLVTSLHQQAEHLADSSVESPFCSPSPSGYVLWRYAP